MLGECLFRFAQHRWIAKSECTCSANWLTGQAVVGFWRESFPNRLTIAKTRLGLQGKGQGHHGAQTTHHPCSGRRRTRCRARCFETHGASPHFAASNHPHFTSLLSIPLPAIHCWHPCRPHSAPPDAFARNDNSIVFEMPSWHACPWSLCGCRGTAVTRRTPSTLPDGASVNLPNPVA